jgi:Spy/CpxP family protein refolding chaperone
MGGTNHDSGFGARGERWRWSRRETLLGGLSFAGVIGALFAGVTMATDSLAGISEGLHRSAGSLGHHGRWHHRHRHGFGRADAEHVAFFVDWTLSKVDATEDQKARAKEIVREGHAALEGVAEEHRANRARWAEALAAPTIDRGAIESLRQDELRLADSLSKRLSEDLSRLAEVLTPEQRARLVEHARAWHEED